MRHLSFALELADDPGNNSFLADRELPLQPSWICPKEYERQETGSVE
jgi:hypothetical protein